MEFCLALEEAGRGGAGDGAGDARPIGLSPGGGCGVGDGINGDTATAATAVLLRLALASEK